MGKIIVARRLVPPARRALRPVVRAAAPVGARDGGNTELAPAIEGRAVLALRAEGDRGAVFVPKRRLEALVGLDLPGAANKRGGGGHCLCTGNSGAAVIFP